MHVLNQSDGIVRVDVDDVEYLFPAGTSVDVLSAHVGAVLREHPDLVLSETPVVPVVVPVVDVADPPAPAVTPEEV